jgi:hypothetical protein
MQIRSKTPVLALAAGEVVTLDDASGVRIHARAGTVWVTEEADPADHIVGPGETRVVAHGGRTVIQALRPAWIALGTAAANEGFAIAANDALERIGA